ncbi:nuclear transport factor 2 family protein [Spongiactinospora sp. TRM90649]|uniref:nuclear transport factor 2 family protein n=1 Tax=Spongiactinospora sp. TRM90649 TaxID=3031114 RepID=UPI0023F84703|nr:nuclear transport factor 2 family protein [Spongiactinospora sp. TRM90649]MDF5752070.1 nuclear transport factor 2 family protein [Spongiactinospora sp. TRM90649]
MTTRQTIERYYEYANAGDWSRWCDLFTEKAVVDEQIAGRLEGQDTLREAVAGFPKIYRSFRNEPRHVVVSGDQAGVVSHISAVAANGEAIEAEVMNYFRLEEGRIAYMANFHDTMPFRGPLGLDK